MSVSLWWTLVKFELQLENKDEVDKGLNFVL